jgi:hypothetical protein
VKENCLTDAPVIKDSEERIRHGLFLRVDFFFFYDETFSLSGNIISHYWKAQTHQALHKL